MVRQQLGALALLAAFALPLGASAQTFPAQGPGAAAPGQPPAAHQRGQQHGDRFMHSMRRLKLSDSQKQQIAGIMKANRAALRQQIDGVLTPDQRAQLHAKRRA